MTRMYAAAASLAVLAGLGIGIWYAYGPRTADPFAPCRSTTIAAGDTAMTGQFSLIDETGARVSEADIVRGLTLVYFGYTYCPDICPADSARNADAVDILATRGIPVTPVIITIDPARDTPDALAAFTDNLHPAMIGLTGTEAEITAAAKGFFVYAARSGEGEDYLMDHSTFSYLMVPGQGVIDVIRRDSTAAEVADGIACFAAALPEV